MSSSLEYTCICAEVWAQAGIGSYAPQKVPCIASLHEDKDSR